MRTLRFFRNVGDDDPNALALVPLLAARLLRTQQDCLEVSQIDDHIAAFEALDEPVDQLADAIDILFVNISANGVADFLKQDLLGGLRGDAAEFFHGHWQQQRVADFHFIAAEFARFSYRQFSCRIGDVVNDNFRSRKFEPAFRTPIHLNVFAATELFLGGRAHGFLDRFNYQLAINALLLAQGFDVLRNRRTHLLRSSDSFVRSFLAHQMAVERFLFLALAKLF